MRTRGLLIAVILLAALAGGVWWSNKTEEAKAKKPPADESPKILSIPTAQIVKIDIRRASGETTVLDRSSGKWQITAPQAYPADSSAIETVASSLASLPSDRLVEEKTSDLGQYGLAKPALAIDIGLKDGKAQHLLVGDETPTGNGFYAALQGDPRVFTIPAYIKSSIDKTSGDLRDKRLLRFSSYQLTRVELAAKGQDIEFGKNNLNEWQILKPRPLRADGGQVEDLITRLTEASLDPNATAEDAKRAAAAFASGTRVAIARVTDSSGTQQLEVRRDRDKSYYAKSSVVEGVYRIPSNIGDALDKGLEDFRNKKIFDFGWNDPTRIEVHEGARQTVYEKPADKWMSGGKEMDSAAMQLVIDKLRDLAATKFPETGFTTPALELTVTSGEGKRVERVALSKAGDGWIARRENEPTLYQLDASAVADLQKALAGVKPAAPAKK
jgi:hypothetical protein